MTTDPTSPAWREYDAAAAELARKGLTGKPGDLLPNLMSSEAVQLINEDPEAFERRVRESAYAQAMEAVEAKHGCSERGGRGFHKNGLLAVKIVLDSWRYS